MYILELLVRSHMYILELAIISTDRAEQHLEFMQESLGGWLSVVVVRKRRFVKISKNTDTRTLTARMEAVRKKLMA